MNEDSFLDSYMESHIGGWTGDEDQYYCEEQYEDSLSSHTEAWDEEFPDGDDDPEYDYPGLDDQNDY